MRRTNVYLGDQQWKTLQKLAKKAGLPVAELVRRAIDEFLKNGK
jgi:predicted DNA-binding ribbon-helix-helix protein